ncbi:MAG: hypothetical protein COW88_03305 [Candidatus Lloydbacteria bacterium CG22_combo_CG10-13_8_21_14_all_47_15]|uniref:Uncharacterized protein n=1 Tax=Candidatus Lloydbacteria bacterium CG22_combo_CG10-13_8_21_14_all_47_15 TaxID=1974635 RepID=A0A2H0CSV7_9BACT|nr:MAG: hypothetical protein COW88_03305 [Candidatus Lloydbacteria bacterium CG22_combo_CG10-13_8_21_14_all_47_15]
MFNKVGIALISLVVTFLVAASGYSAGKESAGKEHVCMEYLAPQLEIANSEFNSIVGERIGNGAFDYGWHEAVDLERVKRLTPVRLSDIPIRDSAELKRLILNAAYRGDSHEYGCLTSEMVDKGVRQPQISEQLDVVYMKNIGAHGTLP